MARSYRGALGTRRCAKDVAIAVLAGLIGLTQASRAQVAVPTPPQGGQRQGPATGDGEAATPGLQEVVVTARRHEEPLQSVPIAVSAFDGEALERDQVHSLSDLQMFVPSATVSGYQNRNQEFFTLRGQGETGLAVGGGVGGGPAVVGYLSEVPTPIAGPGLYYDLASVQVLKGPQGTLFGRNTTGGAILFEPVRPTYTVNGYGQVTVGDYDRVEAQGAVNIPLIDDKLAIRVAGQKGGRAGYTTDVVSGIDYDNRNFEAARIGLLFQPDGQFENYFLANYVTYKEHGPGEILIAANPAINPALLPYLAAQRSRGVRATQLDVHELNQGKFQNLINKSAFKIDDDLTVRNIVSDSRRQTRRQDDEDGTPLIIQDSLGSDPGTWNVDLRTITEELQVQGKSFARRLEWQTGGYYEDIRNGGPQTFTQQYSPTFYVRSFDNRSASSSRGLYGQGTVHLDALLEGLNTTAGYRQTWDRIYSGSGIGGGATPTSACFIGPDLAHCFKDDRSHSDGTSYNFGVDYQLSKGTLLYVARRQGYKQGGFNLIASILGDKTYFAYKPEYVKDVEFGVKADWSLGTVRGRTNLAIYESKYTDAQVLSVAIVAGGPQGITVNAAKATIRGAEIENLLRPYRNLELNLSYSNLDAAYDRYITPTGIDVSHTPYPYAPREKVVAGGRLRLPVNEAAGEVWLGASYAYQSSIYVGITAFGRGVSPVSTQASYGLLNLRLEWSEIYGSRADLAIFATNVTDKVYTTTVEDLYNANGASVATYGEPRMIAGSVRYRF